ncbi:DUF5119 domain-containing protein [uncultured Rikenella sp.]|uniref:DUF5119 domain-containing protein n=1 Tax=uncultured Rikenella sp. TaxID=368003 RepID=UPI0025EE7F84|nr:DUF5119 domain-containing protein [uncultured Rikenella sp.]
MNKILHFGRSKKMGVIVMAVAAVWSGLGTTSCVRRSLYTKPDEGRVIVNFDWKNQVEGTTKPEKMSVYLYGEGGTLVRGESGEDGSYQGTVASGKYKVLAFNEGIEGVAFADVENFENAYAYALPLYNKAASEEQWIKEAGGWLYSAQFGELTVEKEDTIRTTMTPAPRMQHVMVKILVNGDADKVTGLQMALTGVASSIRLCSGECTGGYKAMVPLTPEVKQVDGSVLYSANTLIFGIQPAEGGEQGANSVRLDLNFDNGGSQAIEAEIGPESIDNPAAAEITIDIDVEVSATSEGGFTAQITDFQVTTDDMIVDNRPNGEGN